MGIHRGITLIALLVPHLSVAGPLDHLRLEGLAFRDTAGRFVTLRGVSIPIHRGDAAATMAAADYARIRSWGFNFQRVDLDACRLGMLPNCEFDAAYLDRVDRWIALAEHEQLYTILTAAFTGSREDWHRFWTRDSGAQESFQKGWQRVWERFRGRDAVVGYDVLNEPMPGNAMTGFIHNYLWPFYRRLQTGLAQADASKIFFFQPPLASDDGEEGFRAPNIVYAPHFNSAVPEAAEQFRYLVAMSERSGAAFLIGGHSGDSGRAGAPLFDSSLASTVETGYEGAAGEARIAGHSRPYPQRVAGRPLNFAFDFSTHNWHFEWAPDATGETIIYVPHTRYYPEGFRVRLSSGAEWQSDQTNPSGLRVLTPLDPKPQVRFDCTTGLFTLSGMSGGRKEVLVIEPVKSARTAIR